MSNVIRVAGNLITTSGRVPLCRSGHFNSCAGTWSNRETISLSLHNPNFKAKKAGLSARFLLKFFLVIYISLSPTPEKAEVLS